VINCFGATAQQDIYDLEYVNGKFNPKIAIDYIFQFREKYGILDIGVETVAYQKAFIFMLEAEMRRRGKFLRITELRAKGSKIERAHGFQPYVEKHKFYVLDSMTELITQMTQFPFAKHDDLCDSVTYCPQMLNPFSTGAKRRPVKLVVDPITGY
jgi:predicted phage terminase large subunit-like protein